MKSTFLLICLAAAVSLLATARSKSDEQGKAATPPKPDASDKFIGKEAGEVRDDNGLKMKLVWCPPGKFTMGSPDSEPGRRNEDQVEVTLTKGIWLGKYEVTQSEWKQVMLTEPWASKAFVRDGNDFPATWVNWSDAMEFCRKLTKRERESDRLSGGLEYTLPTEAQWERACRAGTETAFGFGDEGSNLGEYAWFRGNVVGEEHAHQVGLKKPNQWGLHDMHGNAWEWCRDAYETRLPGGLDPEVTKEVSGPIGRTYRGGSWRADSSFCRSAARYGERVGILHSGSDGFRVALCPARELRPANAGKDAPTGEK